MDAEGQDATQVVEINDPEIPSYPYQIKLETANEPVFDVPVVPEVLT